MATTRTGTTKEKMELVNASEANIGISSENVQGVATILNRVLADEHVIYIKTRNYHWNVTGTLFDTLHKLFQLSMKNWPTKLMRSPSDHA